MDEITVVDAVVTKVYLDNVLIERANDIQELIRMSHEYRQQGLTDVADACFTMIEGVESDMKHIQAVIRALENI